MSDRNSSRIMKSSSEGEILDRDESLIKDPTINEARWRFEPESKLKRTFTLPRNPFGSHRSSKRKAKHKEDKDVKVTNIQTITEVQTMEPQITQVNNKKVFRKPSWKKFFHKVVQHVSIVSVPNNRNASGNYDYKRRWARDMVSLSSSDIRVPPTRPAHLANSDKVPGVIGLRNHGNTCFINAVLQCLSHTDILAEYFVLDQYKIDLSRRNKLNSKKNGTKGEVTEKLAELLKSIWTCQYDPEISNQFKLVVDKYGSQYRGNNQHDAQEFLVWLLDKVHEDLNTATKKKYKLIKNSWGRADEVVAAETLANHVRCNNSFVHAVFQAQFRSSLTCPRCQKQSNTFDPFLCVSVPVPQNQRRPVYVSVLYTSQQPRQVRLAEALPIHAEVRELREMLAQDTGISEHHMLITEIDDTGFHRTFADTQPVSVIDTENVYCLELPQLKDATEDSGAYVLLCWVNVVLGADEGEATKRFGSPATMQVGRETSYVDLQKLMLKEMNAMLHDDVLVNEQEVPLFRMRICAALGGQLEPGVDHPLYTESVDQALALCEPDAGPVHLKLVLEWSADAKRATVADDGDEAEEHASVKQMRISAEQGGAVTLEECFELYTRAETLGVEDAWHCPSCNRKQEVVKTLGLWSLPDILVIHLKRFRQQTSKQRSTAKLTTLVDFPMYGFDMSPHLANRVSAPPGLIGSPPPPAVKVEGVLGGLGWSPWKRPRRSPPRHDDNVYDLYAVCNHHGQDLQGGHYTAYCRNPYDTQWYCFDDARVEPVSETALVTPAAYILFYQRRGIIGSYSTSSTASTSSSGSGLDHWVCRMPAFPSSGDNKRNSKSQEELSNKAAAETKVEPPAFGRNARNYATMQPTRRATEVETERHSDDEVAVSVKIQVTSPLPERKAEEKPEEKVAEVPAVVEEPLVKQEEVVPEEPVVAEEAEKPMTESCV